jgi:hypothetical protein
MGETFLHVLKGKVSVSHWFMFIHSSGPIILAGIRTI